jgi:hypothetical protein
MLRNATSAIALTSAILALGFAVPPTASAARCSRTIVFNGYTLEKIRTSKVSCSAVERTVRRVVNRGDGYFSGQSFRSNGWSVRTGSVRGGAWTMTLRRGSAKITGTVRGYE